LGITGCTPFALVGEYQIQIAFAFDDHFNKLHSMLNLAWLKIAKIIRFFDGFFYSSKTSQPIDSIAYRVHERVVVYWAGAPIK